LGPLKKLGRPFQGRAAAAQPALTAETGRHVAHLAAMGASVIATILEVNSGNQQY
jgi:hypothetical protein